MGVGGAGVPYQGPSDRTGQSDRVPALSTKEEILMPHKGSYKKSNTNRTPRKTRRRKAKKQKR